MNIFVYILIGWVVFGCKGLFVVVFVVVFGGFVLDLFFYFLVGVLINVLGILL